MASTILIGDCRARMAELPDASVDSVVCDPPYHLTSIVKRFGSENAAPAKSNGATGVYGRASKGFMGQTWDGGDVAFDPDTWAEVLRVLKPGGHLVAFSGTRTYHRMVCAIEDAGFEIRDQLAWVYGSGFPKSLDVSKAIDKQRNDNIAHVGDFLEAAFQQAGLSRKEIAEHFGLNPRLVDQWAPRPTDKSALARAHVPHWEHWLKLKALLGFSDEMDAEVWRLNGRKGQPGEAWNEREVIGRATDGAANGSVVGLGSKGTMAQEYDITAPATEAAQQWQGWGTALKPSWEPICLARKPLIGTVAGNVLAHGTGALNIDGCRIGDEVRHAAYTSLAPCHGNRLGEAGTAEARRGTQGAPKEYVGRWPANLCHDGSEEVLAGFPESESRVAASVNRSNGVLKHGGENARPSHGTEIRTTELEGYSDSGSAARFFYCAKATTDERGEGNTHPTVKPIALMRWLVRLVTPKGGTVLDPFMGSGSTLLAAEAEQFNAIGCEMSEEYAAIAESRLKDAGGMFAQVEVSRSTDEPEEEAA